MTNIVRAKIAFSLSKRGRAFCFSFSKFSTRICKVVVVMLSRFQHILIPLDFSEKNQAALDVGFELAVTNQARVTLLHIIETIDLPDDPEVEQFVEHLQQRADRELEFRAQRFAEANVIVDWKTRVGKRSHEIVAYEIEHNIDLIVLSSHPVDPQRPGGGLATLSYQVAILARCPVLLVK
ncbi:MAG: universal stress protein [Planctomycetaceae bacterium]|nr:universal stress protein [Planctomycetaceae bacterium]